MRSNEDRERTRRAQASFVDLERPERTHTGDDDVVHDEHAERRVRALAASIAASTHVREARQLTPGTTPDAWHDALRAAIEQHGAEGVRARLTTYIAARFDGACPWPIPRVLQLNARRARPRASSASSEARPLASVIPISRARRRA